MSSLDLERMAAVTRQESDARRNPFGYNLRVALLVGLAYLLRGRDVHAAKPYRCFSLIQNAFV